MSDNEEFFYDPDIKDLYEPDFIMDDESGMTWGDAFNALALLYEEKGHSGPYTLDEFYNAVLFVMMKPHLDSLVKKGLVEPVLRRDGEMGWRITAEGASIADELPDLIMSEHYNDSKKTH